jgi:hypothetical protein
MCDAPLRFELGSLRYVHKWLMSACDDSRGRSVPWLCFIQGCNDVTCGWLYPRSGNCRDRAGNQYKRIQGPALPGHYACLPALNPVLENFVVNVHTIESVCLQSRVCCELWIRYEKMRLRPVLKHILKEKKAKQSRYTPWRRLGERRYSSCSFLTSALDGHEWSASRPGRALPWGKDPRYPLDRRLGGP